MFPRSLRFGAGLVIGVSVGVGGAYIYLQRTRPEDPLAKHPALKHGIPIGDPVRAFQNFVVSYDTRSRNPRWVLEHLTRDKSNGSASRDNLEFFEDKAIEPRFRARLSDFRNSGYDRGHMAPAANHKGSKASMKETFTLSNISPQVGQGFNRDYWARFERFVKELTKSAEEVWVITGPLYLPRKGPQGLEISYPLIGEPPALVSVPTHFYKVVLLEAPSTQGGKLPVAAAFVMSNAPIDPQTPLSSFTVPLTALESVSGLQFFPALLTDERRLALDESSLSWQARGVARKKQLEDRSGKAPQELLIGSHEPLLLEAPSGAPPANGSAKKGGTRANGKQVLVPVQGDSVHLCDHVACQLPSPDWWKPQKEKPTSLPRSQSSPTLLPPPPKTPQLLPDPSAPPKGSAPPTAEGPEAGAAPSARGL